MLDRRDRSPFPRSDARKETTPSLQLHQRRATLVQWYQQEVLPAKQRAEQATNTAREEASKAQSQLGMLQRQKADHEKAKAAIASVLG